MWNISKKNKKTKSLTLERFDRSQGAPVLFGILFFFILCLGAPDSGKGVVLFAAAVMLIVVALRFKVLRDRVYLPFLALTLYVLMNGISTFYAISGKFALREFLKVFLAFMMAVVLLAVSPKKEEQKGRRIATVMAVCTAIGSLVGIDMVSTGWISGAVVRVLTLFTRMYVNCVGVSRVDSLFRMASIFDNSNIFAGFSGLGMLLSLGLVNAARSKKESCFYLVLLYLDALSFVLTISLGAFFFVAVALVVFVLMQKREERIRTLALFFEVLLLTGIAAVLIFKLSTQEEGKRQILPLLCAILGAAALCGIDLLVGKTIAHYSSTNRKKLVIAGAAVVILLVGYVIAALSYTAPITLSPGDTFLRTVLPKPGTYTLDVQAEGGELDVTVTIREKVRNGANNAPMIYSGKASGACFTLPENTWLMYISFSSTEEVRIESARFGNYSVPLDYKLLPGFISRRLGDAGTSYDVAQRLVYFQDGMKLFRRGPVVGLGLGAFENGFKSVQSYYYETKYVHNHYFQTMLDTGIIGLLLFLFLLISSAIAIWKSRKEQPFAPMLAALWMFMAGQALHDVVFSAYAYLPLAYGSFALIDLCCGEAIAKPKLGKTFRSVLIGVVSLCTILYCGFVIGNMMAARNFEREPSLEMLTRCVKQDRFEWADYALQYVYSTTDVEGVSPPVRKQADEYAERLARANSNTAPIYLAEYYFTSDRPEQGMAMLEQYTDHLASDQNAWRDAFEMLRKYAQDTDAFRDCVLHMADKMETWNAEHAGTVTLTDEDTAFIEAYR